VYDEAQFDALCICLALEAGPFEKLCDWLVNLSILLIRPAALQPTAITVFTSVSSRLPAEKRFEYFVNRVAQARITVDVNYPV
jgi:hypothetical protein